MDRQKAFDQKNSLDSPLLSDPDREIAEAFGVRRFGPLPSKRSTFVIGTDRRIQGIVTSEFNMQGHADKALDILRSESV